MFLLISFFFFIGLPVLVLLCIFVFVSFVCWLVFWDPILRREREEMNMAANQRLR